MTSDDKRSLLLKSLVDLIPESSSAMSFLVGAVPAIQQFLVADYTALVQGAKGAWRVIAESGSSVTLSPDFLAEALDSGSTLGQQQCYATPVGRALPGELLVACGPQCNCESLSQAAEALLATTTVVQNLHRHRRRAERVSAMLEMTVRWNQTSETTELLQTMAETSTRLLDAERATIFLWDRSSGQLIGRPALGVDGGELRIPQDTGVVGQVVSSGHPQRVDEDIEGEQAQIDRAVDQELGFQTRSLLCVPMVSASGEIIGAFELINKRTGRFTDADQEALGELAAHAAVAIENTRHLESLKVSQRQVADEAAQKVQLIGNCPAMTNMTSSIHRVAETELAVLILGENGTGKEVVAQMIHYLSPRRDKVLVAVNCAAITETLLESELFGHEKGAFTDAHESRQGKFELADGGTLFLDEIGDMSLSGQAKLLRVLEEKVVVRVGGSTPIPTDARVLAATNQDLSQLVREKKFREDLFFRLNVVTLELPPLRDRGDDIMELAKFFLQDFCVRARRPMPKFTAAARKKLTGHSWPGNVRELRNMMERLAYLFSGEKVDADDLSFVMSPGEAHEAIAMDQPLADATRQFQADYIQRHIRRSGGNMTDAAERLGLHRSNLYRKMKQLGMSENEPNQPEVDVDSDS